MVIFIPYFRNCMKIIPFWGGGLLPNVLRIVCYSVLLTFVIIENAILLLTVYRSLSSHRDKLMMDYGKKLTFLICHFH